MKLLVMKMNELRANLLSVEMELSIIEQDLEETTQNLMYLDALQADLIYNLKFLRRDDVVAVIASYNQSIVQLKEVQTKILKHRAMKLKLETNLEKYEKMQDCYYDDIESVYKQLENDKTILLFRKKNE